MYVRECCAAELFMRPTSDVSDSNVSHWLNLISLDVASIAAGASSFGEGGGYGKGA